MITHRQDNITRRQNQIQGFTIIEVLAGILMATAFVLIATQAIAISALYRVRAQRQSEALQWIQEDAENIKFIALSNISPATCDETATATTGYANALMDEIVGSDVTTASHTVPTTKNLLNRPHVMTRTLTAYNQAPFVRMDVRYAVSPQDTPTKIIASSYIEVVPDAAFNCE